MNQRKYFDPPRIAAAILGWLLKDDRDTALGDYEEYYNELANEKGEPKARWWYRGQVARLLPDQLFEKTFWGFVMLKSYLLLGVRNLRKNKVASSINMIGLSAAIGSTIALFLLIQMVADLDKFHENGKEIFMVGHTLEQGDELRYVGSAPAPLGPALAADFPQVERAVRFSTQGALVEYRNYTFQENISFADIGFFEMLTFPLQQGLESTLSDPNTVIISDDVAKKYFRNQDPMGQTLAVTFGDQSVITYIVKGVAAPFPPSARFTFDFLAGYENQLTAEVANDWATFTDATFIQIKEQGDEELIQGQLHNYIRAENVPADTWRLSSFYLDNIQNPDLFRAWQTESRAMTATPIWEMMGIGMVALMVLLITCFNYITISLGSAARRLKEIGIRKTAGAQKQQLVKQFLTENLVLCFLALLLGIVLAWAFVIPYMNSLISMGVKIDFLNNSGFWLFLVGLLAFIALVSGAYPAFYISSFQPVEILRGKQKLTQKKGLNRTLTVTQFVLTIGTICIALFIAYFDDALRNDDWGYSEASVLVIPDVNQEQYTKVQKDLLQISQVNQIAGSEHHIGSALDEITVLVDGVEKESVYYGVSPEYLSTMGLRVVAGRAFGSAYSADSAASVVINQSFVDVQGWDNPLGEQVRIDGKAMAVVGVVDDFLLHPFGGKAHPVVFGLSNAGDYQYLTMQFQRGEIDQVVASLQATWNKRLPLATLEYFPQTAVFEEYNFLVNVFSHFIGYLALFALFISCMGLFGMASQRALQRIKEIGIRKAMGASAAQIVFLVNKGFLIMLVIATCIATPVCYFALSFFVANTPIEVPMSIMPFVLANVLVFLLAAVTLFMQTRKLVKVNPAEVLLYG